MSSAGADLEWQRTSPVAVMFFLTRAARQFATNGWPAIAVLGAGYASGGETRRALMLSGLLALFAMAVIASFLSWLRFRFCVIDDRVLVRSGVLHREELSVEFDRVQNISIREPFYMRPFGLVLLSMDTAGSSQKEIVLGGIRKHIAIGLRETILCHARPVPDDIQSEASVQPDSSLLLPRSRKDIVIYGLTVNFVFWVLIAIGAFFGAPDLAENFFTWLSTRIQIQDVVTFAQNGDGLFSNIMFLIALGFAMFLLLPLVSVLGALYRHYGYRLSVEGETYRKNSGLLTRHDESLKRHKIQAIVLTQNFMALYFKRTNMQLRVASAGTGIESGQLPLGPRANFLIPALHAFEVTDLCTEFFPGYESMKTQFSRIDRRRFSTVILGLTVLPPVVLVSAILSLLISWKFVLILPVSIAIAWMVISRCWQKTGYAVVGEYGVVRRGFVGTVTTVFPLFKVQRVDIRQTPGQRRKGLAHLSIHLASHSLKIPFMCIRDAEKFRDIALYYVESTKRDWY